MLVKLLNGFIFDVLAELNYSLRANVLTHRRNIDLRRHYFFSPANKTRTATGKTQFFAYLDGKEFYF